jgi:hypothetical protein
MSRVVLLSAVSVVLFACTNDGLAIEYANNMPTSAPDYPGIGSDPYEKNAFEVGQAQSGIYYESVHATYGPTTADGESTGICDGTTISSASVTKYTLACNLLYALFNLAANWQSETTDLASQEFQTCCTGAGCTVPKKYIHKCWSYAQRGKVTKARVKVDANGQLDRNGTWCNWKFVTPCDAGYCTLYTRAAYSSSSTNLAGTHDAVLRTGVPTGSPCNP